MQLIKGEHPTDVNHLNEHTRNKKPTAYWCTFINLAPPKYSSCLIRDVLT
jgi:hypothetical protein